MFVDSACAASPSDFAITVDGEAVPELHTDDGPCENIPREIWFPLPGHQDTAHVCVSVQRAGPEDIFSWNKLFCILDYNANYKVKVGYSLSELS